MQKRGKESAEKKEPHRTFVWVHTIYGIVPVFLSDDFCLCLGVAKEEADGETPGYLGGGLLPRIY